jgi:hypothetical protein
MIRNGEEKDQKTRLKEGKNKRKGRTEENEVREIIGERR